MAHYCQSSMNGEEPSRAKTVPSKTLQSHTENSSRTLQGQAVPRRTFQSQAEPEQNLAVPAEFSRAYQSLAELSIAK